MVEGSGGASSLRDHEKYACVPPSGHPRRCAGQLPSRLWAHLQSCDNNVHDFEGKV